MKNLGSKIISLIICCSGSAALAGQTFILEGKLAMQLTQDLLDNTELNSEDLENGYRIKTDQVVCRIITEKQMGGPKMKAEEIPVDSNCSIAQRYKAIDATQDINSREEKEFSLVSEVGNAFSMFHALASSGASASRKMIVVNSLDCSMTGEFQSGDAGQPSQFLPLSATCKIGQ